MSSLLTKKSEDMFSDIGLDGKQGTVDVSDKDREKPTDSKDLPSHDNSTAMKNKKTIQEDDSFFIVRIDGKSRAANPVTLKDIKKQKLRVQPARHVGELDVFSKDGLHKVAILFKSKAEAMKFVNSKKEDTILLPVNEEYKSYQATLEQVALNSGKDYTELVADLDMGIFRALSDNKKIYVNENAILAHIGQEVLNNILYENTPVSLQDLTPKDNTNLDQVQAALNSSSNMNMEPIELVKGINGLIVVMAPTGNMNMIDFTLSMETLTALSKVKALKWIQMSGDRLAVGL